LDFLKHQDWRKKFGGLSFSPSGEGNKENKEKTASGVKIKSQPSKKTTKKIMKVNNNNKTAKWSMSSVKRSIQMSNKKASGNRWLGRIEKGISTQPNFTVGVKRANDNPTTTTHLSPLSQEQSQSSKSKTPIASQQKRLAVYNDSGSPDVTFNDGRKNLQQYQSLSPCAWTSKYDSPITAGQPSGEPLSETNSPPNETSLFIDKTDVPSSYVFFPYKD
jgi:hypothetical protein